MTRTVQARCICPSGLRYRLLDALSLALLSRHFPNAEKAFMARKLNRLFESLAAEEKYSETLPVKRVDDLLPTFPGNSNLNKLALASSRASALELNEASNTVAVVCSDLNASVRFYDSSMSLKRVVTSRRPTSEFTHGTWTADGNFFAAIADRRRLTLWSLLPQAPPRNIKEEKEARDGTQAREIEFEHCVTSLISCHVKQTKSKQDDENTSLPQAKFIVATDGGAIVECHFDGSLFTITRTFDLTFADTIRSLFMFESVICALGSEKLYSINIMTGNCIVIITSAFRYRLLKRLLT